MDCYNVKSGHGSSEIRPARTAMLPSFYERFRGVPEHLRKRPRMVLINSMSNLFQQGILKARTVGGKVVTYRALHRNAARNALLLQPPRAEVVEFHRPNWRIHPAMTI